MVEGIASVVIDRCPVVPVVTGAAVVPEVAVVAGTMSVVPEVLLLFTH